jgi:hypothetical protein
MSPSLNTASPQASQPRLRATVRPAAPSSLSPAFSGRGVFSVSSADSPSSSGIGKVIEIPGASRDTKE